MRKRISILFLGIFLLLMLDGCGEKEKEEELLPFAKENFTYTVAENTKSITVDEEGFLYALRTEYDVENGSVCNVIDVYDGEGNQTLKKELKFSNGDIFTPIIENGMLYCVSSYNAEYYAYEINLSTWETRQVAKLPSYQWFEQMVLLEGYLYVYGETGEGKTYALAPGVWSVINQGEQICRVSLTAENSEPEIMKIDFPQGIYKTEQNTLMIYEYTEESGFGFLEFNPAEMTLTKHSWNHAEYARSYIAGCGSGYVYIKNLQLFYGTTEGNQVQLLPEDVLLWHVPAYRDGFVFVRNYYAPGTVTRICVADMVRDNKEIRVLTDDSPNDFPFGCGYQMTTLSATSDEFALKVLARDSDFDLFVLDTRNDCAYNLKENGAFYALNKVDGVQEYLDACFPYIKELAYNEDGDIWMIPVDVDIPGIVYNKEFCAAQGVDYSSMNYMEYMDFIAKIKAEEPEKGSISIGTILEPLLMQYVSKYDSFDTELFRENLAKLKNVFDTGSGWGFPSVYGSSTAGGPAEEFYLSFEYNSEFMESLTKNGPASQAYGVSGFPKLAEGMGDMGTITLLAVNPESDNLKETLKYITEYCNYMLTVKSSFMLKDESTYDMDNPFVKDLYEHIAGGTIEFRMSDDVYLNTFWNYLDGEITLDDAIAEADRKLKIYKGE